MQILVTIASGVSEEAGSNFPLFHWFALSYLKYSGTTVPACDCHRESAHRWIHPCTHTHWQTQIYLMKCPMLYAIAVGQITTNFKSHHLTWMLFYISACIQRWQSLLLGYTYIQALYDLNQLYLQLEYAFQLLLIAHIKN